MKIKKIVLGIVAFLVLVFFSYRVLGRLYFHDFLQEVPNVVGLSEKDAKRLLSKNDLHMKLMGEQFSSLPIGQIVLQNPKANSIVKSGRRIQVWTSKGENLIQFPPLVGKNLLEAQSLVEQQGLVVERITYIPKDLPYNEVIATDPSIEEAISKGSRISFLVSGRGQSSSELDLHVPDIIGFPLEDAKQSLLAEQLSVGNIRYESLPEMEAGIVIDTGLPVGRPVQANTKIDLVVSQ